MNATPSSKGKSTRFWLILVGAIFILGVIGMIVVHGSREPGAQILITQNGEPTGTYPLDKDTTLTFESESGGRNVVTIRDGMVFMEEASCPDQICVHHAPTNRTADPIVCLPNRLVVEVQAPYDESQLDGVSQ